MHEAQPAQLLTIRTFSSHMEADLAKSLFQAFGVECFISSDDCAGQRGGMTLSEGVRLIIRPEDRERAEEILGIEAEG